MKVVLVPIATSNKNKYNNNNKNYNYKKNIYNNNMIMTYFARHLDVKVVLVSIATAEQKLLTLIGRSVVKVPRPVACARALLGQKIAKF
jgi:hypothetical protein